nr:DcaP family trimeric outer membrane transporter [Roseomonas acroporae]
MVDRARRRGAGAPRLLAAATLCWLGGAAAAMAQAPAGDAATIAELRRQLDELRHRLEQLESRGPRAGGQAAAARAPRNATTAARAPVARGEPVPATGVADHGAAQTELRAARQAAAEAQAAAAAAQASAREAERRAAEAGQVASGPALRLEQNVPGLAPPEPMGRAFEDALRADLPGIAFRVPGTDTQVRLYGFAKLTGYTDLNGRNQTDTPPPSGIPLTGSNADRQGGDFGMSARFSRFGVDTRTLTGWGTLETRLEGDFGGGAPTSSNATFRLRQAWAELGTDAFRVLAGQANSLWNEGLFETLIDATNLNQSFVRQAQLRVTGRLAPGLTGQFSIEAPETQYTSAAGVVTPSSNVDGGASPAFNAMPDFLGRLTWREDGAELGVRGMLRELQIRTAGTAVADPAVTRRTLGWGLAAHGRLPMRWLSDAFGTDEVIGMAFYGEGIGRYFGGNTFGQDALSTIGLASHAGDVRLDSIPSWGAVAAYRRFWTTQLRSNFSYAYARQDYPGYARDFTPGSAAALSLNREMHQVFANLIWSPFAEVRNGVFGSGWLDLGLEYLFTRRDLLGGATMAGPGAVGHGIANRFMFAAIARF